MASRPLKAPRPVPPSLTPESQAALDGLHLFLAKFRATIIVLSGGATGMEHVLDQRRVSLGRGPGVDLALNDESLACEHAVLEFADGAFHLRSLTSAGETCVNGGPVEVSELKPNDRFELGALSFAYSVRPRCGR